MIRTPVLSLSCILLVVVSAAVPARAEDEIDFNADVKRILSNNCFFCHGPDEAERQADLRLDTFEGATVDLGGYAALVPGQPESSALIERISSNDESVAMPPPESGKKLTAREIEVLKTWIAEGGEYDRHWSYEVPQRPELPVVKDRDWPRTAIDRFIAARLEREGLSPSPEANRYDLIRRLSLDLTGLPPTLEEVDVFVNDSHPEAYERLVDRLLEKDAFGEHMARMWLDLARYADSAGYADDPARTIWGYRDYVIRSFNENKPFDQFTVEQIAGDLLPEPTEEQRIATAFHRNTLTNNEGGTNDEEFRNVAVVDRVNTTMAVWMGTTMACAQCHTHKYDPISQNEYFQFFAFFNNTADADRRDESPTIEVYSPQQKARMSEIDTEVVRLEKVLSTPTEALLADRDAWAASIQSAPGWQPLNVVSAVTAKQAVTAIRDDRSVVVEAAAPNDEYTVEAELPAGTWTALQLQAVADDELPNRGPGHSNGNFVVSRVTATLIPDDSEQARGRFVRVENPGKGRILSLAEVQVFSGEQNIAVGAEATQSSTDYAGPANLAIDGNTDGHYFDAKSTTHTKVSDDPWWEVDLGDLRPVDRIVIWNRTDGSVGSRLNDFRVSLLDGDRQPIWQREIAEPPNPQTELTVSGAIEVPFVAAYADFEQSGFPASAVINNSDVASQGWAVAPEFGKDHTLTLVPSGPVHIENAAVLRVKIDQLSRFAHHNLGRFRLAVTDSPLAGEFARIPPDVQTILAKPADEQSPEDNKRLTAFYLTIAPALQDERVQLAALRKERGEMKPYTTVPVFLDLAENQRRETKIQIRGNYLSTGETVTEGVPVAFHRLPDGVPKNRLAVAKWLISPENPLTARVTVNRMWEKIFGRGIVATSEDFGSQGEPPVHPELLDWLAVEFVESGWNIKHMLRLMVTSAAYRQSSTVTEEKLAADPDNRLLTRGPRFRMTAETVRDQALFVGGLLSEKMYGPPVNPPQPNMGLSAAFGSGIDWKTSEGEDRYRRGLYTTWRRSNPYPSMAAFDAPNREVCTLRRDRTNTPLQALVTMNDPVYIEAAQGLARRIAGHEGDLAAKAEFGFRVCLTRMPRPRELQRLVQLFEQTRETYGGRPDEAMKMATDPLGPLPEGQDAATLAAWTIVGNVLLNLDEAFMTR